MAITMGQAIGYIVLNIKGFEKGFRDVKAQSAQLDTMAQGMGKAFEAASKVIKVALTAITAATTVAIKQMLEAGSNFEAAMSQVAATMGMTADDVASGSGAYTKLSDAAKEAGASTMFSATQAAEALNYLALAGYSVEDSIATLPTILNVAAAGGMDLAAASDMVTDAMSALGLSVDEAATFADKLAKTSQKSNTNVAQLGAGILQIGGTAKSLAGGVNELDTALGILANNGIKAAEGGTALRQIILNLTAPTEKAAAYMEEIGLSAYDAAGNMKPLNQIFGELDEILSSFGTQQERDTALAAIFDARQLKSARALLSNYGESWDNLYEQISNADGAAEMMAETMQQNLKGAITIAKSALEAVQNTIYGGMQKGLTVAVQNIIQALNRLNDALSTPKMQKALHELSYALSYLITNAIDYLADDVIPAAINALGHFDEIIWGVKTALAAAVPLVVGMALQLTLATKAAIRHTAALVAEKAAQLGVNMALLSNPYILVTAAIVGLTAAIATNITAMGKQREAWVEQHNTMLSTVSEVEEYERALDDAKANAEGLASAEDDNVDKMNALVKVLGDYADKTSLTEGELSLVKNVIEELNELYPENTARIEGGLIVGYEGLTEAVKNFGEETQRVAKENALTQLIVDSEIALQKSQAVVDNLAPKLPELELARDYAIEIAEAQAGSAQDTVENLEGKMATVAKTLGISLEEYEKNLGTYADVAEAMYNEAINSWSRAKTTAAEAQATIDAANEQLNNLGANTQLHLASAAESTANWQRDQAMHYADTVRAAYPSIENMWADIAELDRKWQLGIITDEKEYQAERQRILDEGLSYFPDLEYNDDFVKEYAKSVQYRQQEQDRIDREAEQEAQRKKKEQEDAQKKQEEEQKKWAEQQWDSIEDRLKHDKNYTAQMALNDKQNVVDQLKGTGELYDDYYDKLSDDRDDYLEEKKEAEEKAADEAKEKAEDAFEAWEDKFEAMADKYEDMADDIQKAQDDLTKNLIKSVKLYGEKSTEVWNKEKQQWEKKDEVMSTKDIKKKTDEINKYMDKINELRERGLSENVIAEILGMSVEDGAAFAKELASMTDTELAEYSAAVDSMYKTATDMSKDFYAPQFQKMREDYKTEFNAWKDEIPPDWQLVGEETINGFVAGIQKKADDPKNAANDIMATTVDDVKNLLGIHSPSTVFAEIGENVIAGLVSGIEDMRQSLYDKFETMGQDSATRYIDGFKSIWDSYVNNISTGFGGIAGGFDYTSPYDVMTGGTKPKSCYSEAGGQGYGLTKADITSAVSAALPKRDVVLTLNSKEIGRAAINEINGVNLNSGGSVLRN